MRALSKDQTTLGQVFHFCTTQPSHPPKTNTTFDCQIRAQHTNLSVVKLMVSLSRIAEVRAGSLAVVTAPNLSVCFEREKLGFIVLWVHLKCLFWFFLGLLLFGNMILKQSLVFRVIGRLESSKLLCFFNCLFFSCKSCIHMVCVYQHQLCEKVI